MTGDINIYMLTQPPVRPICKECNKLPAKRNGRSVGGYQRWHTLCGHCAKIKYGRKKKSNCCSMCGFVAIDSCQLCFVDGNTICQNCNSLRLKAKHRRIELTVDATVDWGNLTL
jgi:hypothetical protein